MEQIKNRTKARILLFRFFIPSPAELVPNLLASLLFLMISANRVLLVLLADGTPITDLTFGDVYGQRLEHISGVLQVPFLGRVVLFLFWLAIGSIVYVLVWLFQNFAVEVYDDITLAKMRTPNKEEDDEEGWWGTTLSHTIFLGCSAILFLFYVVVVVNLLFPAWSQLFQVGLQSFTTVDGLLKMLFGLLGTMLTVHIFVLFWKVFIRFKNYIYNAF